MEHHWVFVHANAFENKKKKKKKKKKKTRIKRGVAYYAARVGTESFSSNSIFPNCYVM